MSSLSKMEKSRELLAQIDTTSEETVQLDLDLVEVAILSPVGFVRYMMQSDDYVLVAAVLRKEDVRNFKELRNRMKRMMTCTVTLERDEAVEAALKSTLSLSKKKTVGVRKRSMSKKKTVPVRKISIAKKKTIRVKRSKSPEY